MKTVVLRNKTPANDELEATFMPEMGMNMVSFKWGDIQIIDQSTRTLFEERYAGLGALIGPHFHHRNPATIPFIKDESLFPHIARVKAKGIKEPFSHGIARYAPWKTKETEKKVMAELSGKDMWNGIPLAELEGQNFQMTFLAELNPYGLDIALTVVSERDSVVGIHYYYSLPNRTGTVISRVQNTFIENSIRKEIPKDWNLNEEHTLHFSLNKSADFTFFPFPSVREGKILLDAEKYQLQTTYSCLSQENSWQLYHPEGASYVCIEPLSAQDPRHPNLTVSSINIRLEIIYGS